MMTTLTFPMIDRWSPRAVETPFVSGVDGVEARFRAVGAGDELFELAIARDVPAVAGETDPPRYGVVRGNQLEIGWRSAGGEMSMLAAYGVHLMLVRAHARGFIEDVSRVSGSGRFAEVRGRLVQRDEQGFVVQGITAADQGRVSLDDLSAGERDVWDSLGSACACPACVSREWSAEAADAFAVELAADAQKNAARIDRFMVRTPALLRAAMLAGMSMDSPGWRRKRVWGPVSVREAAAIGAELISHKQKAVREVAALAIDAAR